MPSTPRKLRAAILPIVATLLPASSLLANTWDNSAGTNQWSTATNWDNNIEPTAAIAVTLPTPIPGSSTIGLSSGEAALSLTVNDSYILTGGTLALAGTGVIDVANGKSLQMSSTLSGTSGLTKNGSGQLTLASSSAFTGGIVINKGVLQFEADARLGAAANNITINGGTLSTASSVTTSRVITLGASGGTLAEGSNSSIFNITSGLAANANTLTIGGLGAVLLGGASTRTGATLVPAGALALGNNTAVGSGTITVSNGGDLRLFGTVIGNPLNLNDNGSIAATPNATYAGTITVGAAASAVLYNDAGQTLTIGDAANDYHGGIGATTSIAGSPTNGAVILPFANDYAGGWSVGGTLRVANANALGTGTSAVSVAIGTLEIGAVNLARNIELGVTSTLRGTGAASATGVVDASFGNPTFATAAASDTLTIGDAANDLTGLATLIKVAGPGTVVLPFASTYTGGWQLNAGTLRVQDASSLGTGVPAVDVNGGTLQVAGVALDRNANLNNGATLRGTGTSSYTGTATIANNAAVTLSAGLNVTTDVFTLGNAANDLTGGGGTSTITTTSFGNSRVVLTQPSDYVGSWNVTGRLRISNDNQLGNAANPVTITDGIFEILTPVTSARTFNASDIAFYSLGADLTLTSGLGGGSATIIKSGVGTLILQAPSTRTGDTQIFFGVRVDNPTALGTPGTGVIDLISGTLQVNGVTIDKPIRLDVGNGTIRGLGNAASVGTMTVASGTAVSLGTGVFTITDVLTVGNSPNDLTGGTAGASITINGDGKVILAQPSDYVGDWLVDFSTLQIGASDRLGNAANQIGLRNGTLITSGAVSALSRNITLVDNGDDTVDSGGFNSTFGNVDGQAHFIKTSAGKVTVNHVRTSGLTVSGGTLALAPAGNAAGTSRTTYLEITGGAKLDLSNNHLIIAIDPVGTWNGTTYTDTSGLIKSGRNGGGWGGSGIITSQSNAATGNFTTLGIATGAQAKGIAVTATAMWAGQTVTGSDTLVMYTYGGDANLDGKINVDDYTRIDFNVPLGTKGWYNGDFNYDGKINVDDYTIIDFNVGIQGAPFFTGSGGGSGVGAVSPVPEPAAVSLLLAAGALRLGRRRRR